MIELSDDQDERGRAVSDRFPKLINRASSDLSRRFDGVALAGAGVRRRRDAAGYRTCPSEVAGSLRRVEAMLTTAQWRRVPERVRIVRWCKRAMHAGPPGTTSLTALTAGSRRC